LPGLNPEHGEKGRSGIDGVPGRYVSCVLNTVFFQ